VDAEPAAEQGRADGKDQADRNNQQQHTNNLVPGYGVFGLQLVLNGGRHVLPDIRLFVRLAVRGIGHGVVPCGESDKKCAGQGVESTNSIRCAFCIKNAEFAMPLAKQSFVFLGDLSREPRRQFHRLAG
jgi:hypothetical protein